MAIDNETLLDLGKRIVESISSQIRNLSEESPIGARLAKRKPDKSLVEDEVADSAAKSVAVDFMDDPNLKNILIMDAWHVVEDFSAEKIKKLILVGLTLGVKVFGDKNSREGVFVIVDSIDGSNNLRPWVTPTPFITTAVAVGSLGNLKLKPGLDAIDVSVISEVFHGDQYYALRGGGSFFEGWGRLESSPEERLESAIVGVDTDVQDASFKALQDNLNPLLGRIKCKRRLGSSILDFCKVASGEYDAFISCGGRMILSDVAPSKILVEEAGGVFEERMVGAKKNQGDDILHRIILRGEHNLVGETRFNIITSGNRGIHETITSKLEF